MRTLFLVTVFFLFMGSFENEVCAQSVMASDTTVLPYSVSEVVAEIKAYVEGPTVQNEYLAYALGEQGFPSVQVGSALDPAVEIQIAKWVRNNPDKVSKLLYERKKNYDKFNN